MSKIDDLALEIQKRIKSARDIAERAEKAGRGLTSAEQATVDSALASARDLRGQLAKAKSDADLSKAVRDLGAGIGLLDDDGPGPHRAAGLFSTKSLKHDMRRAIGPGAQARGLTTSGSALVGMPVVEGDPVSLPHPVPSLLEALPMVTRPGPVYQVLKQSTRTMNAAPVASGDTKPTSTLKITSVDERLRVIAHLSDPIDKFDLQDAANLQTWVETELADGLREAIEDQILTSDGTGENFTGLAHTSSVLYVGHAGDRLGYLVDRSAQHFPYPTGLEAIMCYRQQAIGCQPNRHWRPAPAAARPERVRTG